MIPPAFNLGLFRTKAKPLPATVAGADLTLMPTEKDLNGSLGFRDRTTTQVVVGGCLMEAVVTVTVTLIGTKGMR